MTRALGEIRLWCLESERRAADELTLGDRHRQHVFGAR